jgi:predicted transporter
VARSVHEQVSTGSRCTGPEATLESIFMDMTLLIIILVVLLLLGGGVFGARRWR